MTVSLSIDSISAHYGKTAVLQDLSLSVAAGELVSLLGSSGCGKTTTLRLVAGFLQPTSGTIKLGDRDLTTLPAHARDIGLVFQNYALFPHLTVLENVAFGLKQRRIATQERLKKATAMLERVGLSGLGDRLPSALSGGQKQRVALARALVIEPPLLMFDEPLSNLDAKLRVDMRVEIRQLQRANGTTSLYVTHDQEEAFSISDRVAIMNAGRIMQLDTPEVLYRKPANSFVARFVGFENLLPLRVIHREGATVTAEAAGGARITLSQDDFGPIPDSFVLGCRADGLSVRRAGNGLPAVLGTRTYLGRAYQYQCETAVGAIVANGPLSEPMAGGDAAMLVPVAEQCCILSPEA
ncbi:MULTISPECIES: ABC transporter ATP-binding protein [unclassified Rhizobium]|uniref:ABC transporter ATP-binding protein n=1 Tax=unclassified Rhizobium TaxID=2613769 RepID=UPI000645E141|nr:MULTISPECIES: ABC transporter ATP-binding protein [unclassified Rhizobium]MBN8953216.1 ABC transporter ATP-binding protein [Rhizobium tropici]OJY75670.1 MAG: Fe3+/spermidine/putrescine ABC transporter ATP-binding protein [Rhizobium sp. 60-20]RKD75121.1 putative spermidine/putrescine transport system ATP-binding protein [Rhizobium sp. WW_1]